jgi:hypothetical protein
MAAKYVDLRGRTFGRLHIPKRCEPIIRDRRALWPCVCECGAQKIVRGTSLTQGLIVSCGCWRRDHDVRQAAAMAIPEPERKQRASAGGVAVAQKRA